MDEVKTLKEGHLWVAALSYSTDWIDDKHIQAEESHHAISCGGI